MRYDVMLNKKGYYDYLVVETIVQHENMNVMIDTGAYVPVWTGYMKLFHELFPKAELMPFKFLLGGFGGKGSPVDVYLIGRCSIFGIEYRNLYVAIAPSKKRYKLIVSFNMLSHVDMRYTRASNITQPTLQLDFDTKTLCVLDPRIETDIKGNEYLAGFDIFTQNLPKRSITDLGEDLDLLLRLAHNGLSTDSYFLKKHLGDSTDLTNEEIVNKLLGVNKLEHSL